MIPSTRGWTTKARAPARCKHGLDNRRAHLPIARDACSRALAHRRWFRRDERLYLLPGDSPMGFRLPMDSLPWVDKADYPYLIETDLLPRHTRCFPGAAELRGRFRLPCTAPAAPPPRPGVAASSAAIWATPQGSAAYNTSKRPRCCLRHMVRTALCVEARLGVLGHAAAGPGGRLPGLLAAVEPPPNR